ncbi:retrovirus-related pol polyprotein from transposon TNT 1-94 [Tanacetum coccineum]
MSIQQDIYVAGSENHPPMLNKENYVPWSSRLLRYAKSRPNGKLIYNSIMNGPYVRRMIPEPEADDQAILGLPEDIYASVDSCETAQEIWIRVQQMMKGSDIGILEKKAKLFNEWERFTSTDGESIESYYHRFSKLMNDFKRNKHFLEKISSNLKFLNNLQPEWSRHVTIVHQKKDLHTADYTQLYDFLKYNQKEVDELRAERLAKSQDPLALMANSNNSFKYPELQQPLPNNNNYNPQPSFNQNYMQQPMTNLEDITDLTANSDIQNARNQNEVIVIPGIAHQNGNGNVVAARAEGNANGNNVDLDEIKEVNAKCILMANLQQASTSGTQTDKAPVYDSDGSAEVQLHDNSYNDEIFNMFTQEDQYSKPLEPIPKPHEVPQNDSNVISEVSSVEQGGGTVKQHPVNVKETRVLYYSLYNNFATEVEKVNSVNHKLRETNANLTTELARYKNQERCFEISQEKYDKLERCLLEKHDPSSVCDSEETLELAYESRLKMKQLNKEIKPANYTKINHLSGVFISQMAKLREELYLSNTFKTTNVSKLISIPNEEFSDDTTPSVARKFLNEAKSTIVTLQRVVKQKMTLDIHNWSSSAHQEIHKIVNDEIFPIVNQVDARVQNFEIQFLKVEAKFVQDFQSLANEAEESLAKHKALELEIERLLRAVISQNIMSVVQNNSVVDTLNLQTELKRTKDHLENCIIKKENEYDKLWNDWYKKCEECKYEKNLYDKAYNDMQQKIEQLQAQLGDQKGISKNTPCVSDTLDPLPQKLENENVELEFQDSTHGKSENTKFAKQSILEKPPSSSRPKLYDVTPLSKSTAIPKVGEMNALSNQVTSNLVHSSHKSKVVKNDKVIAPKFLETVRFGNDHVAAILGFSDLQWGNILITRVYFVEGLGHNLFSVGQKSYNKPYTINLHDMASVSPICLMACATSTKSWLWHQRLSYLNFDTINDLDRNDLVTGLPKFKYHKEHLCPSCEQGKSKRASHPPKPVPNSKQMLHLLHMDLCGPIRIASINGKRYVLVIVDDYSRYTWVVFLRSKDEATKAIKTFLKRITVLLQAPVIINDSEDIRKFGAKGDIRFFIGYSTNSCAYRVYNRRTQKIMETMNVTFDELLAMAFEQSSLKPGLQSMNSRKITMYDDHVGGQPSAASRTVPAAQDPQGLQTTTTSTITADSDTYQFILSSNKYSKHFTEC